MDEHNIRSLIQQKENVIYLSNNRLKRLANELEELHYFKQRCLGRYNEFEEFSYAKVQQYNKIQGVSNIKFYESISPYMLDMLQGNKRQVVETAMDSVLRKIDEKQKSIENEISQIKRQIYDAENIISTMYYELRKMG